MSTANTPLNIRQGESWSGFAAAWAGFSSLVSAGASAELCLCWLIVQEGSL